MRASYSDRRLATLQVYYYMPDHTSLVNEFTWQYNDLQPFFPRTHKFLDHWHEYIEAVIQDINFAHTDLDGYDIKTDLTWI